MKNEMEADNKKKILKNDLLFAGSMLTIYAICCILFTTGTYVWFKQDREITLENATATEAAIVTQQANSTAVTIAHVTEQALYEYRDNFNNNIGNWLTKSVTDEYMNGSIVIGEGVYAWNIREVKQPFIYWADSHKGIRIKDFDVYVDSKVVNGDACTGFLFRKSPGDFEDGAYVFSVCNDSYFYIDYYKQGEWETIQNWTSSNAILKNDWNRLEINARGNHFVFRINNAVIFEMTDDRLSSGGIALLVDISETNPTTIWFDNFGLQLR